MKNEKFIKKVGNIFEKTCEQMSQNKAIPFPKIYQENFVQVASSLYPEEFISFATQNPDMFECNVRNGHFDRCFSTAKEAVGEFELSNLKFSSTLDKNLFSMNEDDMPQNLKDLKSDVSVELKKSKSAIKKLKKDIKTLEKMVTHDYLTRLLNRKTFDNDLMMFVEQRHKNSFLAVLDIDDFKIVNDTYGHSIGDKTLIFLAEVVKSAFRDDSVYRYGGEEFTILIDGINKEALIKRIESLMHKIRKSCLTHKGYQIHLTVSIGITQLQEDDDANSFFNRADKALLAVKNDGKDKMEFV